MRGDRLVQVGWVVRKVVPVDKSIAKVVEIHGTRSTQLGHCGQFMADFDDKIEIIRIGCVLVVSLKHNHQRVEAGRVLVSLAGPGRYRIPGGGMASSRYPRSPVCSYIA